MQAQVKYESEIKTAVLGDRTITVKNLTPVFSPQELEKHNREIERRLFDVFRKYAGQRGYLDDWESVSFDDKRKVVDILISQIDATSEEVTIHWKI